MKKFIVNNFWWISFILILSLLVTHVFSLANVKIDNTTITLLVLVLICPFISAIKKIKFGDFEAEISSKEVKQVKESVETQLAEIVVDSERLSRELKIIASIQELQETDPVIALAKIRIEIEKLIKKLYVSLGIQANKNKYQFSLMRMIVGLAKQEVIPQNISSLLREVVAICNRVIHGEEIKQDDARTISQSGIELIEYLYSELPSLIVQSSLTEERITEEECYGYESAQYKITSIIPLLNEPKKCVRFLTQEGLDQYLDGYDEYAEFIVDITRVADN